MIKSREAYLEQMHGMRDNVYAGGETIALNAEYDYADKKKLARYLAGIDEELDDSTLLDLEPASLDPDA